MILVFLLIHVVRLLLRSDLKHSFYPLIRLNCSSTYLNFMQLLVTIVYMQTQEEDYTSCQWIM